MTPESSSTRTVLITGAGGGIGRVTCREFAQRGYRVVAADCNAETCRETVEELRSGGSEALEFVADISEDAQVRELIDSILKRCGRLDAAFNNAGLPSLRTPLAEVELADWERVIRSNLTGTFLCMKYEIRAMLDQGGGCIVNNSSIFGIGGNVSAPYTAAKHGIAGLTKSAAIAYAERKVRVNAVCPGLIEAGMGLRALTRPGTDRKALIAGAPANRTGRAEEVAKAVLWLCSDEASFVHGHLLAVDGGYGARG